MRWLCALFLLLALAHQAPSQEALKTTTGLPKDAQAVFAEAAPFYDFSNAALKPWHVKATYQLYDDKGNPGEQGTYEYWRTSPQVYRSTWTRPGASRTYWHMADGQHAHQETGERLNYAEYKLQSALFSPLPSAKDLDPANVRFQRETFTGSGVKFPCFMLVPQMKTFGAGQDVPLGLFPTYCFFPDKPILRASFSMGSVVEEFNKIVKVQGMYLPREVVFSERGHKVLSASVDSVAAIAPTDPALIPPTDAPLSRVEKVNVAGGISHGFVLKKVPPTYPVDAKNARVTGTVILQATIGTDGRVHDLRVESTPWPSLAQSALWAVSQWEYKPYLLNGEPVEVETTVNVVFTLGRQP
jgi:TonB family protein